MKKNRWLEDHAKFVKSFNQTVLGVMLETDEYPVEFADRIKARVGYFDDDNGLTYGFVSLTKPWSGGDLICEANWEAVMDDLSIYKGFTRSTWNGYPRSFITVQSEAWERLHDILGELREYPVFDDDVHSRLESERQMESLKDCLRGAGQDAALTEQVYGLMDRSDWYNEGDYPREDRVKAIMLENDLWEPETTESEAYDAGYHAAFSGIDDTDDDLMADLKLSEDLQAAFDWGEAAATLSVSRLKEPHDLQAG